MSIFPIISFWRKAWHTPFVRTNFNSHHARMFCAMFGWNMTTWLREEDKNVISFQQRRRATDKCRSDKLTWFFSLRKLKIWYKFLSLISLFMKTSSIWLPFDILLYLFFYGYVVSTSWLNYELITFLPNKYSYIIRRELKAT